MNSKIILLLFVLFLVSTCTRLASAAVIISELYPAPPTSSGELEWIELANTSDETIDISDWELWDQLTSPSHLHTFPNTTIFPAKTFLVIYLPTQKLNNGGDGVLLMDEAGATRDEFWYSSSQHGKSWQRESAQSNTLILTESTPGSEHTQYPVLSKPSSTPSPSPTANPSPDPTDITQQITLTEFLACPSGGNESVELYNTGEHLTIIDWLVRDEVGNLRRISGELPPFTFTTFEWSGAILRNSGDAFSVITDTEQLIGSASYDSCTLGLSHIFDGSNWIQLPLDPTATSSPNPTPSPTPSASPQTTPSPNSVQNSAPSTPSATVLGSTTSHAARNTTIPDYPLALPNYTPEELSTGSVTIEKIIEFNQPTLPIYPTLSVIIGGLFQLIPGAITLYVKHLQSSELS